MGAEGEPPKWIRRDFVGKRNTWFAISGVVLLISAGAIAIKGSISGSTSTAAQGHVRRPSRSRSPRCAPRRRSSGRATPRSSAGARRRAATTTGVPDPDRGALGRRAARADGGARPGVPGRRQRADRLGELRPPDRGRRDLAILVSLLLVSIYIAFRFEPKFAGPVMIALLHDILITVGIYALLEAVTTATVAALS